MDSSPNLLDVLQQAPALLISCKAVGLLKPLRAVCTACQQLAGTVITGLTLDAGNSINAEALQFLSSSQIRTLRVHAGDLVVCNGTMMRNESGRASTLPAWTAAMTSVVSSATELIILGYFCDDPELRMHARASDVMCMLVSLLPHCPILARLSIHITMDFREHGLEVEIPLMPLEALLHHIPYEFKQRMTHLTVEGCMIAARACAQYMIRPLIESDFALLGTCLGLTHLHIGSNVVQELPWHLLPRKLQSMGLQSLDIVPDQGAIPRNLTNIFLSACSASSAVVLLSSLHPSIQHLSIACLDAPFTKEGLQQLKIISELQPIDVDLNTGLGLADSNGSPANNATASSNTDNIYHSNTSHSSRVELQIAELRLIMEDDGASTLSSFSVRSIPVMHSIQAVTISCSPDHINTLGPVEQLCLRHIAAFFPNLCSISFVDCPLLDNDLFHLQSCPKLQAVYISGCYSVTGRAVIQLAGWAQNLLVLETMECLEVSAEDQAVLLSILNPRSSAGCRPESRIYHLLGPRYALTSSALRSAHRNRLIVDQSLCARAAALKTLKCRISWMLAAAGTGLFLRCAPKLLGTLQKPTSKLSTAVSVCEIALYCGWVWMSGMFAGHAARHVGE